MNPINIFYADDDEDDLMFFNEAVEKVVGLSQQKINLHLHKNGEQLIENIKKSKGIGFAFLDINMPFKTGFELLEEIRNENGIKQFPVVIYSTSSNKDYIDRSQQLGANFYVIKPFEFHDLIKVITTFIHVDWDKPFQKEFLYKG